MLVGQEDDGQLSCLGVTSKGGSIVVARQWSGGCKADGQLGGLLSLQANGHVGGQMEDCL